MAAYLIAEIEVTDQPTYDDYRGQVLATVQKYGGRFIVRGGKTESLEGGWMPKRLIVIEFPSMEQALACHRSPEYQEAAAFRRQPGVGVVEQVIVESGDATV